MNNMLSPEKSINMKDKVVIITGAGSGIGAAAAELFAKEGASPMLTDIQESKLAEVTGAIQRSGGTVTFKVHDISREDQWKAVVDATIGQYGRIDILINNAGITGNLLTSFEERTVAEFEKVLAINLTGQFIGMKLSI